VCLVGYQLPMFVLVGVRVCMICMHI
jgi:hypothetical protein